MYTLMRCISALVVLECASTKTGCRFVEIERDIGAPEKEKGALEELIVMDCA